jgi:acyl-CoA synthetase (AMP-forming)/AMP-acid ligase II
VKTTLSLLARTAYTYPRRNHCGAPIVHRCACLAHFKAPRLVVFGVLPKASTGKIQKFILRDRAKSASAIDT